MRWKLIVSSSLTNTQSIQTHGSITDIDRDAWNGLLPARGTQGYHPFTDWDFLHALEASGSANAATSWAGAHISVYERDALVAAMPLYAKSHSMGEYVFDHGWADASERAGLPYYPKLFSGIPFTPVSGPRLLAKTETARRVLITGLKSAVHQFDMSGAHVTFCDAPTQAAFEESGFLSRTDRQFHFINKDYDSFEHFLAGVTQKKRKNIRAERRRAVDGLHIKRLRGDDLKPEHWDAFFEFYLDTSNRKWGQPYLSREFFAHVHDTMRDHILLILAYDEETPVAGALNFIGGGALYGRNWGSVISQKFLHFELCYYQAIEAGIEMGLSRVEAGAQGEHKLVRGYEPVLTRSAHYLSHPGLSAAVARYLTQERQAVDDNINVLQTYLPYKKDAP